MSIRSTQQSNEPFLCLPTKILSLPWPVGKLTASVAVKGVAGAAAASGQEGVKLGEELPNCGVQAACGAGAFPVHVFSGVQNKEGPKICVSGK